MEEVHNNLSPSLLISSFHFSFPFSPFPSFASSPFTSLISSLPFSPFIPFLYISFTSPLLSFPLPCLCTSFKTFFNPSSPSYSPCPTYFYSLLFYTFPSFPSSLSFLVPSLHFTWVSSFVSLSSFPPLIYCCLFLSYLTASFTSLLLFLPFQSTPLWPLLLLSFLSLSPSVSKEI